MWQRIINFISNCWTAYGKAAMIECECIIDDKSPQPLEEDKKQDK